VEWSPVVFSLAEPVGDDGEGGEVVAHAAVASVHFDVLVVVVDDVEAGLPADDAVGAAVDRRGGPPEGGLVRGRRGGGTPDRSGAAADRR
jgi:hypothetical protein